MNDRRFLELLNLYLDHELSDTEAAELDTAVRSNPERRRTYDEYCRLQRGCSLLSQGACSAAPAAPRYVRSLHELERKIAHPRTPSTWSPLYVGALASLGVAAGIAWLVVTPRPSSSPTVEVAATDQVVKVRPMVLASAAKVQLASVTPAAAFSAPASVIHLGLRATENLTELEIAATDREALAWMQRVDQLPRQSLSIDEQIFAGTAMQPPDTRVFHRHSAQAAAAEFTGFQFDR